MAESRRKCRPSMSEENTLSQHILCQPGNTDTIMQGCQIAQWRLCGLNLPLPLASAAMCRLSIGADLFLFFHPQSESAMEE